MISIAPPFILRFSKGDRRVFQQNQLSRLMPVEKLKGEIRIMFPELVDRDAILLPNILGGAFAGDSTVDGTTRQ